MYKNTAINTAILLTIYKKKPNQVDITNILDEVLGTYIDPTNEDLVRELKSGGTAMDKASRWGLHRLKELEYVENPERGFYKITQKGIDFLKIIAYHMKGWLEKEFDKEGVLSGAAEYEIRKLEELDDGTGEVYAAAEVRKMLKEME